MKKIFVILAISSCAACSESAPTDKSADSANVSNKIDNTTQKMNGMSDSTKAKMDSMVNKSQNDVKMMADSSKMK